MALPWWQHHKHCLGYYYYYIIRLHVFRQRINLSRPTFALRSDSDWWRNMVLYIISAAHLVSQQWGTKYYNCWVRYADVASHWSCVQLHLTDDAHWCDGLHADRVFLEFVDHPKMKPIKDRTVWVHINIPGQSARAADLPSELVLTV